MSIIHYRLLAGDHYQERDRVFGIGPRTVYKLRTLFLFHLFGTHLMALGGLNKTEMPRLTLIQAKQVQTVRLKQF